MRGRKPVPTPLRILKGNPGRRPYNANEPQVAGTLGGPPAFLSERQQVIWREALANAPCGLLTPLDASIFAIWVTAYASAAGLAAAAALGRARFWPSALLAAGFAIGSLGILPSLLDAEREAFTSFRMQSPSHEQSREAAGILLCAAYASWLAIRCRAGRP